ncbi:periplasmic binding family protein [Collimonas arenae]|uniref:Periplasmic binding family protein n=1 Tax=Collimonas arenae TaxID=279058 RepID=A0A127PU48_9BURK|nr:cobalamin-binding protein [Collimonas arenae]AMP01303.1 periplasmic binding family protein [Collimonas arenae]AMP11201.1 periplasmic binding family protein [Collimonas arenae]
MQARRHSRQHIICLAALLSLAIASANAGVDKITVQDDTQHTVTLPRPAHRIISLAPHVTELLFAAGAGPYVIGVSAYSDYPPVVKQLPSVGDSNALDAERIIALKPDLVVAWNSGNSASQLATLRAIGIPVFESEPHDFAAIASSLERLSILAGTENIGKPAAAAFRARLAILGKTYQKHPKVRVFYQIWQKPLMTLNDHHLVSSVIRLCGGENIFGKLSQLAPTVSTEAVLQANPEVIFAADSKQPADGDSGGWRRFPALTAVMRNNLFALTPDQMSRPGPRILDGATELCQKLDVARARRK